MFWIVCRDPANPETPSFKIWETLLTVPLLISAAMGLIDIAERRIGFFPALAFGGLALADAVLLADQWLSGRTADDVVINAQSPEQAIAEISQPIAAFKKGKRTVLWDPPKLLRPPCSS